MGRKVMVAVAVAGMLVGGMAVPGLLAQDEGGMQPGGRGAMAGMQRVAGEVTAVAGSSVTITTEDGGLMQIVTTDNTRVMKGRGVTVKIADLKAGDGVMAAGILDAPHKTLHAAFVFAQDAITGFVRSMGSADKMAFYSYSRDLARITPLTADREAVLRGVRSTVAGDKAALYNCLLLTVKDAAKLRGRKAIVVFSNGPDDASSVPPEDVEELAQSTGTIIYIISTRAAESDPLSTAVFERMSKATGGKAYFAKDWRDEKMAFGAIQDDLAHLYTIAYYPKPNRNQGWRSISVKLVGKDLAKYHVRTRDGYRVLQQEAAAHEPVSGDGAGLDPK